MGQKNREKRWSEIPVERGGEKEWSSGVLE